MTLILGIYPDVGIAALVLFLVPVTVVMHAFWADRDPAMRQIDLVNFGKNVGAPGVVADVRRGPAPLGLQPRAPGAPARQSAGLADRSSALRSADV